MKRKPTGTRSFLHQLAEPMPSTAIPLIAHKPTTLRGAAPLSAIPPILDVREPNIVKTDITQPVIAGTTGNTIPIEQQLTPSPNAHTLAPQAHRKTTSARHPAMAATDNRPARTNTNPIKREPNAAAPILQSTQRELTITPTAIPSITPTNPQLESVHAIATQPASPHGARPHPSNNAPIPDRRPGISVHIGTIEVRVPPPPTRTPQPAPSALNPRSTQHAVPSRAAEPLSRSLAWSHGLVQG